MEMPLAGQLGAAQLAEHRIDRHGAELRHPKVRHDLRLPSTGAAAPIIADETRHAQALVRGIVTTFDSRSASIIVNPLRGRPDIERVRFAARTATDSDAAATVFAAATLWEHRGA